jgi:hypothetical protein
MSAILLLILALTAGASAWAERQVNVVEQLPNFRSRGAPPHLTGVWRSSQEDEELLMGVQTDRGYGYTTVSLDEAEYYFLEGGVKGQSFPRMKHWLYKFS